MEDGVEEYQQAITDMNETFKSGVKAFAKWFAASWKISHDEWVKSYEEPPPSAEYIKGYNAGVESIEAAVDSFLGDHHY